MTVNLEGITSSRAHTIDNTNNDPTTIADESLGLYLRPAISRELRTYIERGSVYDSTLRDMSRTAFGEQSRALAIYSQAVDMLDEAGFNAYVYSDGQKRYSRNDLLESDSDNGEIVATFTVDSDAWAKYCDLRMAHVLNEGNLQITQV